MGFSSTRNVGAKPDSRKPGRRTRYAFGTKIARRGSFRGSGSPATWRSAPAAHIPTWSFRGKNPPPEGPPFPSSDWCRWLRSLPPLAGPSARPLQEHCGGCFKPGFPVWFKRPRLSKSGARFCSNSIVWGPPPPFLSFTVSPAPQTVPAVPHRCIPALFGYRRHAGPRVARLWAADTSLPSRARRKKGVERLLADHPEAEREANTRRPGTH